MKALRIIMLVVTIALMITIFCLSAETAKESSATSRGLIKKVISVFVKDFYDLPLEKQNAIAAPFQFIVRKSAHFTLYFLLGVSSLISFLTYNKPNNKLKCLISAGFCLAYAVSDEIHQRFVPGRSGELRDVAIDFCGAVLGICIIMIGYKLLKRKGKRKFSNNC